MRSTVDSRRDGDPSRPPAAPSRHLHWEGSHNTRDLGGLRTRDGRHTAWGQIVRSDDLDLLTAEGWSALRSYGIRTLVDLRDESEQDPRIRTPEGLTRVSFPLEDLTATDFWKRWRDSGLWCTPLYYPAFMRRFPDRCAGAVASIARAAPGGVVVHCKTGRDRTGLVTLLILSLVGVMPGEIADDYELSASRLRSRFAALGQRDQAIDIRETLTSQGTSGRASILATLASLDAHAYLRSCGVDEHDLDAVRRRFLPP